MHQQQFAFNDIFSETTGTRALILGMKHCLVDFYKEYSDGSPGIQNGPAAGVLALKIKYT